MNPESVVALERRRDYPKLVSAMSEVIRALKDELPEEDALRRSFELAVEGFQSGRALLLLVDEGAPPELRHLEARGLTPAQVQACESGESVKGVSSKLIRAAIETGRLKIVQNSFFLGAADKTQAFETSQGEHYSAICAPVRDGSGRPRAVIYLSNAGQDPSEAYGEDDGRILEDYTEALGRVFAAYFERTRREEELRDLRVQLYEGAPELIGDSAAMMALRRSLHEVYIPAAASPDPEPLLVMGESGTGKDLIARYVHAYGGRAKKPLRIANCADITDELAAARFSGHSKGAFTGASRAELGYFRDSDGGVLFLDEIGELRPGAQAALLRAIDSRTVVPVGDTRERKVDVYVVLATNRDLEQEVRAGRFREDLYRRFRTNAVVVPPLRERPWDIPPLVAHFLRFHTQRVGKASLGLTEDALRVLVAYSWPGNVREVKNVCGRLVMHSRVEARLDRATVLRLYPDFGSPAATGEGVAVAPPGLREATMQFQRDLILSRLEAHAGDVRATYESLGVHRNTFRHRLKVVGLSDAIHLPRES